MFAPFPTGRSERFITLLFGGRPPPHLWACTASEIVWPLRHTQLAATRMCRLPSLALSSRTRTSAWAGRAGARSSPEPPDFKRSGPLFLASGGATLKQNARNSLAQHATAIATNGNVHISFASSRLRLRLRPTVVAMTPDDAMALSIELQKAAIDARQHEYHGTSCVA